MPWLTIIMTLLSYFLSKKGGASDSQALLTAGLVGGATYYTTHNTEWGRTNLGKFDGVVTPGPATAPQLGNGVPTDGGTANDPAIRPGVTIDGKPVNVSPGATSGGTVSGGSFFDTFKNMGISGTVGAVGVAAVASDLLKNPLVLAFLGLIVYKVIVK